MLRIYPSAPPTIYAQLRNQKVDFAGLKSSKRIRRTLWDQQQGRCAYCERALRDPDRDDHQTKIEHFHPQNASEWTESCAYCSGATSTLDAQTTWKNLLLVCKGIPRAGGQTTCDTSKGNEDICARFRNPKMWEYAVLATVKRSGRIDAAAGLPDGADDVINRVLNLNDEHLISARRSIIAAVGAEANKIKARHNGLTRADREKLVSKLKEQAQRLEFATTRLSLAERLER